MEIIKDKRDNLSPTSDSSNSNGTPEKDRMKRPQVYSTKYGTQYVNAVEVIQSDAGWAEIERILDAELVQKPTSQNGATISSPPNNGDAA